MTSQTLTHSLTDAEVRRAEHSLERYAVHDLAPGDLVREMQYWDREITVLRAYPPGTIRDHGIAWTERKREAAVRRLRVLERAQVHRDGLPPQESPNFDAVRHVDLVGLAETLLAQAGRKQGDRFLFTCPFHHEDTPSLTVYPPGRGWYCFGCGMGGSDAVSFVSAIQHCNSFEALRFVETLCDTPGEHS